MHFAWAWTTALQPEAGVLRPAPPLPASEGSSPLPPLLCQLGKWNGESLLASGLCLDLPHPQFLAPWAKRARTPSLAVPLGGPSLGPKSPPFGCAECKVTWGRRDGELVLFAASFLPLQGRGRGRQGSCPSFRQPSRCHRVLWVTYNRGEKRGVSFTVPEPTGKEGTRKFQTQASRHVSSPSAQHSSEHGPRSRGVGGRAGAWAQSARPCVLPGDRLTRGPRSEAALDTALPAWTVTWPHPVARALCWKELGRRECG